MLTILIIAVVLVIFAVMLMRYNEKKWWDKFNKKPFNFPFRWHGKTLWYSRSCAVSAFIFCKNPKDEWCVLANQRGKGAADYHHKWNCPCGYIDWDETAEEAAAREVQEETSIINIPLEEFKLHKLISSPSENRQNITARFFVKLEGDGVTTEASMLIPCIEANAGEKDEVEAVAWIPVSEINNYEWAFNHKEAIEEVYEEQIVK